MIIETHSHINISIPGIDKSSYISYGIDTDDIEKYIDGYKKNKVDKCFVFMTEAFTLESRMKEYNTMLAAYRDMYPDILYPWGTVQPSWPEKVLVGEIERIKYELKLCGLKFVPILQGFPISGSGMDLVAKTAERLNLPVTFHDGSCEYCSAIQVVYFAREYPGVKVMSAHGGLREHWPDLISGVKSLDNLYICLSGPTQWGIQKLYDELGADKLMFGSDGGIGHPEVTAAYIRRINALRISDEDREKIFWKNALRFIEQ